MAKSKPHRTDDADFEPERLLEIFNGDRSAVADILAEAMISMRELIDRASSEMSLGDTAAVAGFLHTLIGVSANIGANKLSAVSREVLEQIREEQTFPGDVVDDLRSAYDSFVDRAQKYLGTSTLASKPTSPDPK